MPSYLVTYSEPVRTGTVKWGWSIISADDLTHAWRRASKAYKKRLAGINELKPGEYRLYLMGDDTGTNYLMKPNLSLVSAARLARLWTRSGGWCYILRPDGTDIRDRSDRPTWRMLPMPPGAKLIRHGQGPGHPDMACRDIRY